MTSCVATITGLCTETIRYGQTIGELMNLILPRMGDKEYGLANPHGKMLPSNMPIRGNITLTLKMINNNEE